MIASNSFCVPRSVSAEPGGQHLDRGEERRGDGGQDEEDDLGARHRHADIARRDRRSPPQAKIQLPKRVREQDEGERARSGRATRGCDTGMPCSIGRPSARCADEADVGKPASRRPRRSGRRRTAPAGSFADSSWMPETWVRPVMSRVRPSVRPRSMNRLPSVTMKEGSRVRTTIMPFS